MRSNYTIHLKTIETAREAHLTYIAARHEILTERELEMLTYLASGLTSEDIGRKLYICKETVDSHRKNIIKKLRVTNVTAAVAHAIRNAMI